MGRADTQQHVFERHVSSTHASNKKVLCPPDTIPSRHPRDMNKLELDVVTVLLLIYT
jgi:hypothetical protein